MNAVLFDVALTAYILAAVAAIASLAGRRDQLAWVALLLTQAGWICHTGAVILRGIELRRLPVSTLAEMISLLIWAVILLDFWVERHRRVRPLSAFVLPVVLALGLGLPTGLRSIVLEPAVRSGWIMVHVALVLVGLAEQLGITVIGYVRPDGLNLYAGDGLDADGLAPDPGAVP